MSIFCCDWSDKDGFKCARRPYAEIFPIEEEGKEEEDFCGIKGWKYKPPKFKGGWSYLCFRHFIRAKLRGDHFAWCKVDTDREAIESIREELCDIQSDLWDIKEKLGINDSIKLPSSLEKLWDNPEDECWNDEGKPILPDEPPIKTIDNELRKKKKKKNEKICL